ncbi:hypothetical protein ACFQBQ_05925 [Granulicella cerasi]|uniref:Uncharacterized protein n=1 Tax=Granulicella cerasi TaxID=741063 RepID=A0ABW1Z833_9BACT|nr:hypothetical protein [Granulicella cerasi]
MSTTFQQALIPVADAATFGAVKGAIDSHFSAKGIEAYLKSLDKAGLRIREFEVVAKAGKLGADTAANYAKLNDGDQGMIREHYLASLEKVSTDLRDKYFKIYAYY